MKKSFFTMLWDFYGPSYPIIIAQQLKNNWYDIGEYFAWFWSTGHFSRENQQLNRRQKGIILLYILLFAALITVIVLCFTSGRWQIGSALLVTYPIVLTHLVVAPLIILKILWFIVHPKKLLRTIICSITEKQVVRLRKKHSFVVVAVAGSVGKTSTKAAIAKLFEVAGSKVLVQDGNYNDRVTVPLVLFGQTLQNLFSPSAWFRIIKAMRTTIKADTYPYEIVVLELGTDGPGQMYQFAYLKPDVSVLTAVSAEHMEFFGTLAEVAREELEICNYSLEVLINIDDTDAAYLEGKEYIGYGSNPAAVFRLTERSHETLHGQTVKFNMAGKKIQSPIAYLGKQGATIALAAAATASVLEMPLKSIEAKLSKLTPFSGRMQILEAIKDGIIIDDTYNSSPLAVKAALDVLYRADNSQKIAILGDMNELGDTSRASHKEIGTYCDPTKLDLVVTIGAQAKLYLAPMAEKNGCKVASFDSPYEAGLYVKSILTKDALILAKGSQNRVFAEESLKILLKNPADAQKLVRQSSHWLSVKKKQFPTDQDKLRAILL